MFQNECFHPYPAGYQNKAKVKFMHYLLFNLYRFETLDSNPVLQLDPAVPGVFNGPYPLGIDPVRCLHLPKKQFKLLSLY